jgi:trimethylamine--corrinoid protein Co-methyltransferase
MPGIMHPRTGDYQSSTFEGSLLYPLGAEMAHRWGVPTLAGIFGTDAQVPGWQSAAEAESSLLLCALVGAETGSGMGLVESCMLLYPEAVLLDADVYHRVRNEAGGLDTSPEAIALDVIKEVGPRGHFLAHRHTRTNLRRRQFSDLTGQQRQGGGYRDPLEVAREKVDWILANHHPQPLEEVQKEELTRILKAADRGKGH